MRDLAITSTVAFPFTCTATITGAPTTTTTATITTTGLRTVYGLTCAAELSGASRAVRIPANKGRAHLDNGVIIKNPPLSHGLKI